MKLTAFTNYALRTLMFAALREGALSQVEEVAQAHRISRTHVVKCVHQLGRWGYLANVRGRGGGFRLARPPETITVGEVVRRTEDGLCLVDCFDPATSTCPLCGACALSRGFSEALKAFMAVLDDMTIADIARNRAALLPRLGLDDRSRPKRASLAA
ncbi:Rrf2 family transcriptional regulator [Alsobacter soli]|uniref:Rrf2 family transcriptional regulator n=1 Tax=Alsobacter soli TaxID=2109933 RepID=A0A2T1HPM9_9HYPH|nr:Rrf2 family transcriptional regulator [Alsobacter soli]PSC03586.1 Rrf2 family transcriptional regulator [Alsobacter soli]